MGLGRFLRFVPRLDTPLERLIDATSSNVRVNDAENDVLAGDGY